MNLFHAHKPAYMTGFEEPDVEFETLEQLLAAPQPKRFSEDPDLLRFSQDKADISESYQAYLMAEMKDGKWWVVGFLRTPVEGLPDWKHK